MTKNRWGRGTAHSIPEPARGTGHLVIRHSGFSSPRAKGLPQQLSQPAPLRNRKPVWSFTLTFCLVLPNWQSCQILENACYIGRWSRFCGIGKQEGIHVQDGALPGSGVCHLLEGCKRERDERSTEECQTHKVIWSVPRQQAESHPQVQLNPQGVL